MKPVPTLHWTTEPPKVPGWYWYRRKSNDHYNHVMKVGAPMIGDENLTAFKWAGPIPEPLDSEPHP